MTTEVLVIKETRIADYIALLKPRVMSLVVFSGACGMMVAPGHIHPVLGLVALFALAVGAGAAGAINMWYDRDIDAVMTRTKNRPIPAGLVNPDEALGFGVALSIFAVLLMALAAGPVAAAILAFANLFYSVVYT
ncbi:MAG: protoheme IX farnesyltransferase, partial [Proteobacteria bacterium]|nr:protoheme IX farnesyltransferase [Pseudomonadota bacterium]